MSLFNLSGADGDPRQMSYPRLQLHRQKELRYVLWPLDASAGAITQHYQNRVGQCDESQTSPCGRRCNHGR